MSQRTYIVSAHGNYNAGHRFLMPNNVKVYFYVPLNTVLYDRPSYKILGSLKSNNNEWKKYVNHTVSSGDFCPSYYCWDYPEIGVNSGIIRRRTMHRTSLRGTTPEHAAWLTDIIDGLKRSAGRGTKLKIHWLCCTSEYKRTVHDAPVTKRTRIF